MEGRGSSPLKEHHRAKLAFCYARVSTPDQAEHSRASVGTQEDQLRFALEDGFPLERIRIVDSDLGASGTTMANRVGIGEVREAVDRRAAGAIYVSMLDRIGRNDLDSLSLIKACIRGDVMIVENGAHYNPRDLRQLIPLRFKFFLAEMETFPGRVRIGEAIGTFIGRKGELTGPPIGYGRSEDGASWVKDPDPRVRSAVEAVFRIFPEEGSVHKTIQRMRAEGIQVPRRQRVRKGGADEAA